MSNATSTSQQGAAPPVLPHAGDALPPGTRLGEFEIRQIIGSGGFGIVYQAWDHALEREVALKEYMPVTLAGRGPGPRVTIRSHSHEETFALGLRSFVNEARMLARFDHPSLVKVYRFWEDNGTAYMAMQLYHGRTLRQVRQAMGAGSPGEAWCRALIDPLLGALERLHREDVFHRDIAPDNIMLCDDGKPVLLDFGAARRVIGDKAQALTAILKPHFAPIEQYADVAAMRQGPWTDLYALAATMYYMLTGQPPLPAAPRALHDELPPLTRLQPSGCSPAFLQALDWAMAVRPHERPQSVVLWRDVLEGRMAVPSHMRHDVTSPGVTTVSVMPRQAAGAVQSTDFDPTVPMPPPAVPGGHSSSDTVWRGITVSGPSASALAAAPPDPALDGPETLPHHWQDEPDPQPQAALAPRPAARRRTWLLAAIALGGVGLIAAGAVWHSAGKSPAAAVAAAAPAPAAAPARPKPPMLTETAAEAGLAVPPPAAAPVAEVTVKPAAPEADKPRPAPRAKPAATVQHSAETERAAPRELCANHRFLAKVFCVKRECDGNPQLHNHPQCVQMREMEERNRGARREP